MVDVDDGRDGVIVDRDGADLAAAVTAVEVAADHERQVPGDVVGVSVEWERGDHLREHRHDIVTGTRRHHDGTSARLTASGTNACNTTRGGDLVAAAGRGRGAPRGAGRCRHHGRCAASSTIACTSTNSENR